MFGTWLKPDRRGKMGSFFNKTNKDEDEVPEESLIEFKDGRISITGVIDLAPFFTKEIQGEFFQVRDHKKFVEKIVASEDKFHSKKELNKKKKKREIELNKSGLEEECGWEANEANFFKNGDERVLDKLGYDIGIFRGIVFNDFFTPKYSIHPLDLLEILDKHFVETEFNDILRGDAELEAEEIPDKYRADFVKALIAFRYYALTILKEKLAEEKDRISISVKISKAGIGYLFLEMDFREGEEEKFDIEEFQSAVRFWLESLGGKWGQELTQEWKKKWKKKWGAKVEQLSEKELEEKLEEKLEQEPDQDSGDDFEVKYLRSLKLVKTEMAFNSNLWVLAILSLHFFIVEKEIDDVVSDIIERKHDGDADVGSKSTESDGKKSSRLRVPFFAGYYKNEYVDASPPIRNYLVSYVLPDKHHFIEKKGAKVENGSTRKVLESLELEIKTNGSSKETSGICGARFAGRKFLSLLENSAIAKNPGIGTPEFSHRSINDIVKKDLSDWKDELCLIMSEAVVISKKDVTMLMGGRKIESEHYWRCVVNGLGFILGGKVLTQVIHRLVFECLKTEQNVKSDWSRFCILWKRKDWRNILSFDLHIPKFLLDNKEMSGIRDKLPFIANLLARSRIAATTAMVSRGSWARVKFDKFIEETGVDGVLKNIETSFEELSDNLNNYRNKQRHCLMVAFAVLSFIGAVAFRVSIWGGL